MLLYVFYSFTLSKLNVKFDIFKFLCLSLTQYAIKIVLIDWFILAQPKAISKIIKIMITWQFIWRRNVTGVTTRAPTNVQWCFSRRCNLCASNNTNSLYWLYHFLLWSVHYTLEAVNGVTRVRCVENPDDDVADRRGANQAGAVSAQNHRRHCAGLRRTVSHDALQHSRPVGKTSAVGIQAGLRDNRVGEYSADFHLDDPSELSRVALR